MNTFAIIQTLSVFDWFTGMQPTSQILVIIALAFGFYMAWNIGANDVANAMGTSVGSGALTLKKAIIVAAIFEFAGAYFVGSSVSNTIRKGIFDPALINEFYGEDGYLILAIGMIASLLAAGVWLQLASYFGWPVSTTHSIVGAVVGFGCVALGPTAINWGITDFSGVTAIASSWIISPVLAAAVSYLLFRIILKLIFFQPNPVKAAKKVAPFLVFITMFVMIAVTSFKGLKAFWKDAAWLENIQYFSNHKLGPTHPVALLITMAFAVITGVIGTVITSFMIRKIEDDPVESTQHFESVYVKRSVDKARKHLRRISSNTTGTNSSEASDLLMQLETLSSNIEKRSDPELTKSALQKVERIFVYLQILSACFVAFSHGANDVANAIGPLSAAVQTLHEGAIIAKSHVPEWALILGGVGIVIGLATWGWRVMETIGRRITELTPTRGFTAEFAAAITILIASLAGMPISTTHTLVGAVLGVGLARGIGAINLNTIRDIFASWIITIPAGACLAILFFYALKICFI
ncbi:Sulfate permease CysP [Poriferisphaera corsica]|uniref:Phosphate transporter n=1 Tax=Poriferisphaera corsica TaxID=2528020 RepID=A0A517YQF7_9BACT|nr:inorganic phosphate transporter [Poriferisphaera corsica]QDU32447.1 Sulfate permease CysP [Poriferisphaera corsica]